MNIRSIHFIILGILSDSPKHGYQIHKSLMDPDGIGAVWKIKITNIYGLLDALEKNECIVPSKQIMDDTTYPPKKYFEITERGKKLFQRWRHEPVKHGREIRQVFLSKLYFASEEGGKERHQLIQDQINECKQWLNTTKQLPTENTVFIETVNSFRLMQIKCYIKWLEEMNNKNNEEK